MAPMFREDSSDESFSDDSMSQDDSEAESDTANLEDNIKDTNAEDNNDEDSEDEVVKAIKAALNEPRDHPPAITSDDYIEDISFHPAKNMIALATQMGDVLLYEYCNEETKLLTTLELHVKPCRDVEFDNNGDTLVTAGKDKAIMFTDLHTGKLKKYFENAHEEPIYCLKCLDNNKIVSGDESGNVKLWDIRKPQPIFSIKVGDEYVSDMITSNAQKYLVCAGGDGILTTLDLKASKIYTTSEEYDSELTCMGLFRSDTKLLVGSSKGKMYMFNWREFGLHSDEYMGNKHSITCMIPITQNIVVTSGEDGILRAAHLFPQRQLGIVGQHTMPVEKLDISHDGKYIASCALDNSVKFWNIKYFESIDSIINVNKKQDKKKDMRNNLPSNHVQNPSDFFSGLL